MLITPLLQHIVVRFARKPIWMPTAPSKLFRITEHTFYTPEEREQSQLLINAYLAQIASLQEFMKREFFLPIEESGGLPTEFLAKELEADKTLLEDNARENQRIALIREQEAKSRIEDLENTVMAEKMRVEEKLIDIGSTVDEFVRRQKADPHNFVTPENIDRHIEKAMDSPVSFSFCIDKSGKQHRAKAD